MLYLILFLAVSVLPANAVPVYTDTTYPQITVTDTAEFYKVTINDLEGDSLFDIAYAWGVKPHVYAYVAVANDDTANWQFSAKEQWRWEYFQRRIVERWDQATYNKHPMIFAFFKNPFIINYTKQHLLIPQIGLLDLTGGGFEMFYEECSGNMQNPYINICIDGGNYYANEVGLTWVHSGNTQLGSTFLADFDDSRYIGKPDTNYEYIDYVGLHELCHPFINIDQQYPYTDGNSHYRSVLASVSPNGKSGGYEVYDPLNSFAWSVYGNHYCAPLSQMSLGIRSKYEDTGIAFYGGKEVNDVFQEQWRLILDTVSSKNIYENTDEKQTRMWNLNNKSLKVGLSSTVRAILIPKSEQQNRSLLVYASDITHPGYYRCFSLGARSDASVINNTITGLASKQSTVDESKTTIVSVRPNPFRAITVISVSGVKNGDVSVYNLQGGLVRGLSGNTAQGIIWDGCNGQGSKVKPGVYIVRVVSNGEQHAVRVMLMR